MNTQKEYVASLADQIKEAFERSLPPSSRLMQNFESFVANELTDHQRFDISVLQSMEICERNQIRRQKEREKQNAWLDARAHEANLEAPRLSLSA